MSAPHEPTNATRAVVQSLAQFGIPQAQIAKQIGVSVPTLTKHYRAEIESGETAANLKVAQNLFSFASGAKGPPPQQVTAAIFWAKTRMGWREIIDVNNTHTYVDGARERLAARLGGANAARGAEGEAAFPAPVGRA